ncbi:class I SAM-dependent methyltransferase [Rhodoferax saidenbachensis]|uniref:2-polyprenyl-3-methyl-5-hydroxy-6-metoxy-1, 4-benzoquinol methylase n=1 Tax=Rhodoferax saidenbachensis TaxID=1484693 RepID=A0ABU1ZKF5_9BURK|nr:class I SAM-dependent methyltransferase [Rhodoferax saidenbachensis]MDR7306028.1 2-polyprenyl-3-methyl-5-hydroxy-6-metoxy-1,4-benzoquinol methylase [Rhodoferax saidenbachensis]
MSLPMSCPVCGGSVFALGAEVFDDRYGEPNRYQLACCNSCGHVATEPRFHEADLPRLYGTYYPRKKIRAFDVTAQAAEVRSSFASLKRWWNGTNNQGQYTVRSGEIMLDVGCGSGVSLLEAKALGATAFGIEADPNVKPIAAALGLKIHFGSLQDKPFPDQSFDLIVMNQVIEHLPDPDLTLQTLRERLMPNGRMVLVFPNTASLWRRLSGSRWINWHIPYHLHHFDRKSFTRMAKHCGLEVVRSRTITPNVWTLLQLRANRYQPQRGQPSPIWMVANRSESAPVTARKFGPLRGLIRVGALSLFAVFNRIVDLFGMGDSLLVELRRSEQ